MFRRGIRFRSGESVLGIIRLHLISHGQRGVSLTVGPPGPLVMFDQSPRVVSLLCPNRGEATAIVAGERRLPAGSRRSGWIRETEVVLLVVAG